MDKLDGPNSFFKDLYYPYEEVRQLIFLKSLVNTFSTSAGLK
jgi:hypothetical protein